jgi:LEA14-like dessication related protein
VPEFQRPHPGRVLLRSIAVSIILMLSVAGCSSLKLEKPTLSIVNVEMLKSDLLSQRLKVRLHVQNPNDRALPIKGITYGLEVAGEPFADGVSAASFVVPPLGEAEFDMNVTANMAGTLIRLLGQGSSRDSVDYRMRGKISLSEGFLRSIPFEERGSFKLR